MTSLGYAILGLLAREPMSGYDVAQRLKLPIGYFWTASHSQIYPELDALARAGHVTFKRVAQSQRPDKKLFAITASGRRALAEWVTDPPEPRRVRDELLLKTYSCWVVEPERAAELFRAEEARMREHLGALAEVEQRLRDRFGDAVDEPGTEGFASYATLRAGFLVHGAWAEWAAWMVARLEATTTSKARRRRARAQGVVGAASGAPPASPPRSRRRSPRGV
jgi:DNA-binding PadR family transcriptional regulator